jgi:hypothetical protein
MGWKGKRAGPDPGRRAMRRIGISAMRARRNAARWRSAPAARPPRPAWRPGGKPAKTEADCTTARSMNSRTRRTRLSGADAARSGQDVTQPCSPSFCAVLTSRNARHLEGRRRFCKPRSRKRGGRRHPNPNQDAPSYRLQLPLGKFLVAVAKAPQYRSTLRPRGLQSINQWSPMA